MKRKKWKKIRLGLIGRIIIALIIGAGAGPCAPVWMVRTFNTFNGLFGQYLGFLIPLLIVGLVAPAIADIGRRAGRMLLATALLAYAATLVSGFASYLTAANIFPGLIAPSTSLQALGKAAEAPAWFTISVPPLMEVMTALIFAFMLGLGMAYCRGEAMRKVCEDFREIIARTIGKAIIPLLPLYIFGIVLNMAWSGQAANLLSVFLKIIGIIFLLHIGILLLQYSIAGLIARRNPLMLLWRMMPAYFTALGTQSSAATIPITLQQTLSNKVHKDVAGFVIPLCATIHLSGSTLKIVACAIAIMLMQGIPVTPSVMVGFIFMLGVIMVAAPGVPGGAIMASLGILHSMLGFGDTEQALMIALYITMDNFGTACNVTGDGALAVIINRFYKG
ncbi:MAG: dicarboxylate/amino acid:cation symporter [Akkermansia sp.]|nr:dicarboxylate/amino acid:cation symporter [Akkermansia sp.]